MKRAPITSARTLVHAPTGEILAEAGEPLPRGATVAWKHFQATADGGDPATGAELCEQMAVDGAGSCYENDSMRAAGWRFLAALLVFSLAGPTFAAAPTAAAVRPFAQYRYTYHVSALPDPWSHPAYRDPTGPTYLGTDGRLGSGGELARPSPGPRGCPPCSRSAQAPLIEGDGRDRVAIGDYACRYCGRVADARVCADCARKLAARGIHPPVQPCVYCGRPTTNGAACPGCDRAAELRHY